MPEEIVLGCFVSCIEYFLLFYGYKGVAYLGLRYILRQNIEYGLRKLHLRCERKMCEQMERALHAPAELHNVA